MAQALNFPPVLFVFLLTAPHGFSIDPSKTDPATPWTKPQALKSGDTIAFAAPAGPADMKLVLDYSEKLKEAGLIPLIPPGLDGRKQGYLGGTDEQRATELNQLFGDPKVKAIFPVRGGYGLTRILDKLDYEALRKNPKIITGYSDLTALHLAIAKKCHLVTFHAPMPMRDLKNDEKEPNRFAGSSFRRALLGSSYPVGQIGYTIDVPADYQPQMLAGGKARGRLLGGNLTLICSTLGTPYAIQPEGAILFIEDVNEAPYRVDRSLSQLRLAGVLDKISGLVVGSFSTKTPEEGKDIDRVIKDYFGKARYPVITHFPVGHIPLNATLPHGGLVELDGEKAVLKVLENPVKP